MSLDSSDKINEPVQCDMTPGQDTDHNQGLLDKIV